MGLCQDPCEFHDVCAISAKCVAKMHRPICSCPLGHEGNPMVNCTAIRNETSKNITNLIIENHYATKLIIFVKKHTSV